MAALNIETENINGKFRVSGRFCRVVRMQTIPTKPSSKAGFTLTEVVICIAIMALVFSGVLTGYVQSSKRAEWSGYCLAAQALGVRVMEQFRAASWDTQSIPPVDQTTNVPTLTAATLDVPISGTNVIWATNYATVTQITVSSNPAVYVKMIRVDTVWPSRSSAFWQGSAWYTNTIVTYRSPDQ